MKKEINLEEFDSFLEGKMNVVEKESFTDKVQSSERVKEALLLHEIIVDVAKDTSLRESIRAVNVQTRNLIQDKQKILFKRYLNNELSVSEKVAFEEKLYSKEHQLFSYEFQNYKKKESKPTQVIPMYVRRILQIAAFLLIGIVSFMLYTESKEKKESETLYASYYEAPPHDIPIISAKSEDIDESHMETFLEYDQLKLDGLSAFGNQQYITAAEKLEKYIQAFDKKDETINFLYLYIGLSYKERGDVDKCIEMLKYGSENIIKHPHLRDLIRWHLALAYLKKNQIEETQKILNDLSHSDHPITKKDANNLLKEIK